MMDRISVWLVAFFVTAFFTHFAFANGMSLRSEGTEQIKSSERPFVVRYQDGSEEKIVVKYVAQHYHKLWQEGESSKVLEGHPVDDRRCKWRFNSWVERKAFFIHPQTGIQAPLEGFERIYYISATGDRGPEQWYEILYHRTCEDSMGAYNSEKDSHVNGLLIGFDKILADDRSDASMHLKDLLGATEVRVPSD